MNFIDILSIVTATISIQTGFLALFKMKGTGRNGENISFFFLMMSISLWVLNPHLSTYYSGYPWLSASLLIGIGIFFLLHITDVKFWKWAVPLGELPLLAIPAMIIFHLQDKPRFPYFFLFSVLPACVIYSVLLISYSRRSRSLLHISFALTSVLMALSGIIDTLMIRTGGSVLWLNVYASLAFSLTAGFNIVIRGYLSGQSWKDYQLELKKNEALLRDQNILLKHANSQSVMVLSQTIEAKDPYTRGHCIRVRDYSRAIAREMGLSAEDILNLEYGAILHDVGKLVIPGIILNKQEKLTKHEFEQIKIHPTVGARILGNVDFFRPMLPMVKHHHERFDGKGYPSGIKGHDIPLEARILAIADAYDAMTSDRPYRKAMTVEQALDILHAEAGLQLDPELVLIFVEARVYETPHVPQDKLVL